MVKLSGHGPHFRAEGMYDTRQPERDGDFVLNPSNFFLSPKMYAALPVVLVCRFHMGKKINCYSHV